MKLTDEIDEIPLSEYGCSSSCPSPVSRMMSEFALEFREGIDINLGIGYVNERTIPRKLIEEAQREVLAHPEKYRVALNYGSSKGSPNLIESISKYYTNNKIGCLDEDVMRSKEIIIGPNGATSLLNGISQLIRQGIVITSDPLYYIYCNHLRRAGFEILSIPEDEEGVRIDLLREGIEELGDRKSEISFFYIVTINNPTSTIISNERKSELIQVASRLSEDLGREVPVFFDRAYEDIIHDPDVEKPRSGFLEDELGIVYEIGTLSKVLAPALRVGYMIGARSPFMQTMVQRTNDVGLCPPLITQEIASYILDNHIIDQLRQVNEGYRRRALDVKGGIDEKLGDFILDCRGGKAGFYYYLTFKEGIETDEESSLFKFLKRATGDPNIDGPPGNRKPRVVYIPGEFCVHPEGEMVELGRRQMRISYGYEEPERIREALGYIKEGAIYTERRR
ncbi:MAG: pyridoxal phosphate-dependent aminotransferase [Halobacteriota archaeon]|nr:pyridoxal phosphate-dependent aminotransferase [Halobacteriota archaeon]